MDLDPRLEVAHQGLKGDGNWLRAIFQHLLASLGLVVLDFLQSTAQPPWERAPEFEHQLLVVHHSARDGGVEGGDSAEVSQSLKRLDGALLVHGEVTIPLEVLEVLNGSLLRVQPVAAEGQVDQPSVELASAFEARPLGVIDPNLDLLAEGALDDVPELAVGHPPDRHAALQVELGPVLSPLLLAPVRVVDDLPYVVADLIPELLQRGRPRGDDSNSGVSLGQLEVGFGLSHGILKRLCRLQVALQAEVIRFSNLPHRLPGAGDLRLSLGPSVRVRVRDLLERESRSSEVVGSLRQALLHGLPDRLLAGVEYHEPVVGLGQRQLGLLLGDGLSRLGLSSSGAAVDRDPVEDRGNRQPPGPSRSRVQDSGRLLHRAVDAVVWHEEVEAEPGRLRMPFEGLLPEVDLANSRRSRELDQRRLAAILLVGVVAVVPPPPSTPPPHLEADRGSCQDEGSGQHEARYDQERAASRLVAVVIFAKSTRSRSRRL